MRIKSETVTCWNIAPRFFKSSTKSLEKGEEGETGETGETGDQGRGVIPSRKKGAGETLARSRKVNGVATSMVIIME